MAGPCVPEGLAAQPYQTFAVRWCRQRANHYLALDPGLGKTIVAALIINETVWNLAQTQNQSKLVQTDVRYVCPPGLVANVEEKMDRWLITGAPRPTLVPDNRLQTAPKPGPNSILFVDEAHRFMHEKTGRTKALFDYARGFSRVILMSGTPLPNSRPRELWPILVNFAPDVFGRNYFEFARKYCGAQQVVIGSTRDRNGELQLIKRWQFNGFSAQAEFKGRLFRSFMLRIRKSEVLSELPPKHEELLTVGDMPPVVGRLETKVLEHYTKADLVEGTVGAVSGASGAMHLSTYLKHLGRYKVRYVVPYLVNVLETTTERLLVFARHVEAVEELARALSRYEPLVISGATPAKKRHGLVSAWCSSTGRLMVANIDTAGVGLDVQVADRVVLVEYSWRDGDNQQAGDRAHRFGRVGAVRVQYVVLRNSIDAKRMATLLDKRANAV